jgi:hypothetical protein
MNKPMDIEQKPSVDQDRYQKFTFAVLMVGVRR